VVIEVYDHIAEYIENGISQAKSLNQPILVSQVIPIESFVPSSFFFSEYAHTCKHRFIWSTPTNDFECVGLGALAILRTNSNNRYHEIEVQWESILRDCLIIPKPVQQGTGPLLFGGFSFDPQQTKETHWKHFGDGLFILPRYMYSVVDGGSWLTLNIIVGPEDSADHMSQLIEQELAMLTSSTEIHNSKEQKIHLQGVSDSLDEWTTRVQQASQEIHNGNIEKIVLARQLIVETDDDFNLKHILDMLDEEKEMTYRFAIQIEGDCFVGASPERLIKKDHVDMYSSCLAGSTPRGQTDDEDERLGEALLQDSKNLHEHDVVLRMIKDMMGKGCVHLHAPSKPNLYKGKYIQHLYTPVKGESTHKVSLLQMVGNLHPTPALGGHPRIQALSMIRNIENFDRGWYASPLGWIDHQGQGEFSVGIRSALIQGNKAHLYAGCGIVNKSIPIHEFEETGVKFRTMLSALRGGMT
jgi:menaquinone-specific isochorismate synthase